MCLPPRGDTGRPGAFIHGARALPGRSCPDLVSDIARHLYRSETVQDTLQEIAELACQTVQGCDYAGLSFIRGKDIETPAQTDPIIADLDALQAEIGEGPSIDAIVEHETFYAEDLSGEDRWPTFARTAMEQGMRSLLSFRLFVEENELGERTMGALNLYSRQPAAFNEAAREVG